MQEKRLETFLLVIRSLIALSVGMVVALLTLTLAFWLQAEYVGTEADVLASTISFITLLLLGGLATGLSLHPGRLRIAVFHGLGLAVLFLLIFLRGALQSEDVGTGLVLGWMLSGLLAGGLGGLAGHWLRHKLRRKRQ
ncbi:FtsH-binding integral membrane protein [Natronospira proteinivora]|uniref:FtsH-binding integral membrane protein n=1 Tax=Natronospira proteinivora TaxID=1807133 RepID=A0ABT1GB34_9GAMM|nr:hypothetical protein [Natronospira proteinivora]MCP1728262.1 FtsH-binding integral membrane protein [Natronospira proteinivora]